MLNTAHKRTLTAVQLVVYTLWPSAIFAAQVTLGHAVADVPLLAWLTIFILSTVSSLAALLNRLKFDTPPRLPVFVAAHVLGSWLAGVLIFFVGTAVKLDNFLVVGAIAIGSYAGAQLMDRWSQAFTNRVAAETERVSNGTKAGTEQK